MMSCFIFHSIIFPKQQYLQTTMLRGVNSTWWNGEVAYIRPCHCDGWHGNRTYFLWCCWKESTAHDGTGGWVSEKTRPQQTLIRVISSMQQYLHPFMVREEAAAKMTCSCIDETLMPRQFCFETSLSLQPYLHPLMKQARMLSRCVMRRPYHNHVVNSTVLTFWDVESQQHRLYVRIQLLFRTILS
jgi:hypothetical protein